MLIITTWRFCSSKIDHNILISGEDLVKSRLIERAQARSSLRVKSRWSSTIIDEFTIKIPSLLLKKINSRFSFRRSRSSARPRSIDDNHHCLKMRSLEEAKKIIDDRRRFHRRQEFVFDKKEFNQMFQKISLKCAPEIRRDRPRLKKWKRSSTIAKSQVATRRYERKRLKKIWDFYCNFD